jgi:hypothetical protein
MLEKRPLKTICNCQEKGSAKRYFPPAAQENHRGDAKQAKACGLGDGCCRHGKVEGCGTG